MISDRHRKLYRDYYAVKLFQPAPRPSQWLERIRVYAYSLECSSILDYGSGAARCISGFAPTDLTVTDYDPGVPGIDAMPDPHDMVVCVHALEHVEEEMISDVLDHIRAMSRKATLIVASCEASTKTLPDGSPWHSFVRPDHWWHGKLSGLGYLPVSVRPGMEGREYAALWYTS